MRLKEQMFIARPGLDETKYVGHPVVKSMFLAIVGCTVQARYHYIERPSGSDAYLLMYCFGGKGWFRLSEREKVSIGKQTAIVVRPGTPYVYGSDAEDPWSVYFVHLKGEHAEAYFRDVANIQVFELHERDDKYRQLFSECCEALQAEISVSSLAYGSHLVGQLLSLLLLCQGERFGVPPSVQSPVNAMIEWMRDHVEDRITLQQLSQRSNLSKPHVIKLFKKHTGYSPIDYFLRMKIRLAGDYLDLTHLSVKEVCFKLAFTDPYYFSRLFTKIMGEPPSKYRSRKKARGGL